MHRSISKTIPVVVAALVVALAAQSALADVDRKQDATTQPRSASPEGVVNVNTATATQLALLPGVGPSRAEAIIQTRQRRPFRSVNDMVRVRGIGRATIERLRPYVRVEGETTLTRSIPMRRGEP